MHTKLIVSALAGWATGLAMYGGVGYLLAGPAGLAVGAMLATAFAAAGALAAKRMLRRFDIDAYL